MIMAPLSPFKHLSFTPFESGTRLLEAIAIYVTILFFIWLKYITMSADQALNYLVRLIADLALPASVLIVASWRVARMRGVTTDRIDESVAETLKEQCGRVIDPLFTANNVVLPPGRTSYYILDTLVPGDNITVLANMYDELSRLGVVDCNTYALLLQTVNTLWGGYIFFLSMLYDALVNTYNYIYKQNIAIECRH